MTTRVLFRVSEDEVTAVFPDDSWSEGGKTVYTCYAHIGQHGSCDRGWYNTKTRAASESEYRDLLAELKLIGYDDLRVMKRWNR